MPPRRPAIRSITAQFLMTYLPFRAERVTRHVMFLIAAASIASALPQNAAAPGVRPIVQARATMRVVSAARIQWDRSAGGNIPPVKTTVVRTDSGPQPAKLVEFE